MGAVARPALTRGMAMNRVNMLMVALLCSLAAGFAYAATKSEKLVVPAGGAVNWSCTLKDVNGSPAAKAAGRVVRLRLFSAQAQVWQWHNRQTIGTALKASMCWRWAAPHT